MRSTSLALIVALLLLAGCSTPPPGLPSAADAARPPQVSSAATGPAPKAAASQAPEPGRSDDAGAEADGMMEKTRKTVRSSAEWLARGVDSWFGDKPFEDGGKVSDGRVIVGLRRPDTGGTSTALRLNARFRLPNLEERAYAFVGRDDERDVIEDIPGGLTRDQRLYQVRSDNRSFFAGLGVPLSSWVDMRVGFRGGIKPYGQARYSKPWQLTDRDLLEFRETVFWSVDERVGSTTALSFERAISRTLAVRLLNAATITQESEHFKWSSVLGTYRGFGEQRLLALEAIASGAGGSGVGLDDYGLQVRWEQPVHKDWLLGEVVVGYFRPRPDEASARESSWAFGGYLKMHF